MFLPLSKTAPPLEKLLKRSLPNLLLLSCLCPAAFGQRDYDPNFNHFYMGRQQWTIEDNSPVIINRAGTAPGAMNGALPNRGVPLPKAGWQGYAPIDTPKTSTGNPKSSAGSHSSRTKHTAGGNKGQAGTLTKSPSAIQGYKPYSTYSAPAAEQNAANSQQTSQHVKGSLLHWARRTSSKQE